MSCNLSLNTNTTDWGRANVVHNYFLYGFVLPSIFSFSSFPGRDIRSIRRATHKGNVIFNFNDITQPIICIDFAKGEKKNSSCNKASNGSLNRSFLRVFAERSRVPANAYHRLHIVKAIYIMMPLAGHRGCTCTVACTRFIFSPLPSHFETFCNVWETNNPAVGRYKLQQPGFSTVSLSAVSTPFASCCTHPVAAGVEVNRNKLSVAHAGQPLNCSRHCEYITTLNY